VGVAGSLCGIRLWSNTHAESNALSGDCSAVCVYTTPQPLRVKSWKYFRLVVWFGLYLIAFGGCSVVISQLFTLVRKVVEHEGL
jgi:hypothetical protein